MRSGLFRAERLSRHFALFADEHFDPRFGFFELFAAGLAEAHAALEKLQRALQGEVAGFEFLDDLVELIERGLEGFDGFGVGLVFRHRLILTTDAGNGTTPVAGPSSRRGGARPSRES